MKLESEKAGSKQYSTCYLQMKDSYDNHRFIHKINTEIVILTTFTIAYELPVFNFTLEYRTRIIRMHVHNLRPVSRYCTVLGSDRDEYCDCG